MVAFTSMSITGLNTTWRAPEQYRNQFEERFTEPSALDLLYQFAWRTTFVELRVSLLVGITLRSIGFITLNRTPQVDDIEDANGLQCATPVQVLAGTNSLGNKYIHLRPTSQGLKWASVATTSCHPRTYSTFQGLLEIAAAVDFSLALLNVFYPANILNSFMRKHMGAKRNQSRRIRGKILLGVIDQCGNVYAGLNLGYLPSLFGTSLIIERGNIGRGKIRGRRDFGRFDLRRESKTAGVNGSPSGLCYTCPCSPHFSQLFNRASLTLQFIVRE